MLAFTKVLPRGIITSIVVGSAMLYAEQCGHGRGQHIANDLAIIRLVLHHQNALAHAASTCRSTITGSEKANVEPWPGCDSTQIRPPCILMMRFEMANQGIFWISLYVGNVNHSTFDQCTP